MIYFYLFLALVLNNDSLNINCLIDMKSEKEDCFLEKNKTKFLDIEIYSDSGYTYNLGIIQHHKQNTINWHAKIVSLYNRETKMYEAKLKMPILDNKETLSITYLTTRDDTTGVALDALDNKLKYLSFQNDVSCLNNVRTIRVNLFKAGTDIILLKGNNIPSYMLK